ncbi:MAG: helix-turn-helix domain-containing protein [Bacilli bacterium]|nr:helix-turn-helix domain-containing protein [Bacilli bacterium]
MDNVKIGKLIAKCRKEKKLTQKELAEKLGVTDKSVSKWENGNCLPDVSLYMELCEILGITLNEFFLGERIKEDEFKEKAYQNLLKALESSAFSLDEKINYYRKKWQKDHRFELTVEMIVCLILFFIFFDNKEIFILTIIGSFILSVIKYNQMMAYIESHAYKKSDE